VEVLVIANQGDDDPGLVGAAFTERGARLSMVHREQHASWPAIEAVDVVISLGSEWSVYWDHVSVHVEAEAAFLRRVHAAGVSIFGICFGAQIVAHALGGSVRRASAPEIGWYVLSGPTGPIERGPWFEWHVDAITPPAAATILAKTDVCVQAYTVGPHLAVQFHPEVTEAEVASWSAGDDGVLAGLGLSGDALVDETRDRAAQEIRTRLGVTTREVTRDSVVECGDERRHLSPIL